MFVPQSYYDKLDDKRKARKGDILLTVVGSFGIPILITDDTPFVFLRHIAILRPNPAVIDARFLYYTMMSKSFYAQADAYAIGAAQRTISLTSLRRMKIAVPDLETQRKIADTLAPYDSLIDSNNKQIKILEQMAENLYKEWFVRFRFPGYQNSKFENGIPEGWGYVKLDKVLTVLYGKDHSKLEDGDIPVYGSGGIMRYGNRALYDGESVLIPRKGSLNNIMWVNQPFWTVDTMFYTKALIPHAEKYVYYVLSSLDMASFNTGAALPSMTTDILYHLKVLVPSEKLLSQFDVLVSDLYEQRAKLESQNEDLCKQRDLLLPRLMSGKLEV
jgi:type I restriction enzyme S subunit